MGAPPLACTPLRAGRRVRTLERDVATGATLLTVVRDEGRQRIDALDLEFDTSAVERYQIRKDDPISALLAGKLQGPWKGRAPLAGSIR